MKKLFITATDTDAGKTHIACAIVNKLVRLQQKVAVYKPISAGCEEVNGQLINDDALRLKHQANCDQDINQVNPIAYKEPIAPHIAAQTLNQSINVNDIIVGFEQIQHCSPDYIVSEGAGGWRLPLGQNKFLSAFPKQTNQDVVLIVNMKLGCLNHALLTFEAIKNDGLHCLGWVANCQEPMSFLAHNIEELNAMLPVALLGVVNHEPDIDKVADLLDITPLL